MRLGLAPCLLGTWCTTEGASESACPPKQLEGAEGLGTALVMAETVKIKGRGAKGFPGQLG